MERIRAFGSTIPYGTEVGLGGDDAGQRKSWRVVQLFVLTIAFGAFVRNAWVSDDAFIAFRAMHHLDHGLGLVSNVGERVQGFTNPLWILLLTPFHAMTHESYFTAITVSLLVSVAAAVLLIFKLPVRPMDGVGIGIMLAFSRAFSDFSTSGLENPLIHLLTALFLLLYFRAQGTPRATFGLFLLAGLLMVTRMDTALLTGPVLLHHAISSRKPGLLGYMVAGLFPVIAWEAFSVLYYGFPFPNTAYAKLNVSIPSAEMMMQGVGYLQDSLARDPITLLITVFALVSALASRHLRAMVPMLGVLLYLAYVVKVGGDFMSGRFLTSSFVVSLAVLGAWILPSLSPRWSQGVAAVVVLIVLSAPFNPLSPTVEPCAVPDHGITDERSCYYEAAGLLRNVHRTEKGWSYQKQKYWQVGLAKRNGAETVHVDTLIGFGGYAAGPRNHIVDPAALTDPLLARIPFTPKGNWRIGHFYRENPAGYIETLRSAENQIKHPCIRRYYDKLSLVIRGPIFSIERFKAIIALNFGTYDYLLEPTCDDGTLKGS